MPPRRTPSNAPRARVRVRACVQDGNVWEKAGVNVSVVYGTMPPEAYR